MACATCGGTMQNIGEVTDSGFSRYFWCPRCGTLLSDYGVRVEAQAPSLVKHVRSWTTEKLQQAASCGFGGRLIVDIGSVFSKWHTLGIFEAIWQPKDRPPEANWRGY